VQKQNSEILI